MDGFDLNFDPDLANLIDFAKLYRCLGLQAVPALPPEAGAQWKRPAIRWREYESELVSDDVFRDWFTRPPGNLGILTGDCSGGVFCVDSDLQKGPLADQWWLGLLAVHNNSMDLETPTQRTGGGGAQRFFRAPDGWRPPTGKFPWIATDIRGVGGFCVTAPSLHESGRRYEWLDGLEPWNVDIMTAPAWLCAAIDAEAKKVLPSSSKDRVRTETPAHALNIAGELKDGREMHMTQLVWAAIVDLRRECPIFSPDNFREDMKAAYYRYEGSVTPRHFEQGKTKTQLLEAEGRGPRLFKEKWLAACARWDTTVREAASIPKEGQRPPPIVQGGPGPERPVRPSGLFEWFNDDDIRMLPEPNWLVEGAIIEKSLSFIYAEPGAGKSFVALSLARALATNKREWMGRTMNRTGAVIYISSEGLSDMKHRIKAWQIANSDFNMSLFYLIPDTMNFTSMADVEKLTNTIQAMMTEIDDTPVMIIVDTVSRVLAGVAENEQGPMSLFVAACDHLRVTFDATVLAIHHTAKNSGQMRGSSVLLGAGDSVFSIEREEHSDTVYLVAQKIKAAVDGWKIKIKLDEILLGDIKGTTSLVARHADATERPDVNYAPTSQPPPLPENVPPPVRVEDPSNWPDQVTQAYLLWDLIRAWDSHDPWSCRAQAVNRYFPTMVRSIYRKVKPTVAMDMMRMWMAQDLIVEDVYDKHTKKKGLRLTHMPDWAKDILVQKGVFKVDAN
jgi:hypothetical protein